MIEIRYHDREMIICVKPIGMLSEASETDENNLPFALKKQLGINEIYPVHRLDRTVGGIMVYAKTKTAAARLSSLIQNGQMHKTYLAVLDGIPEKAADTLEDYLSKDAVLGKAIVAKHGQMRAKKAVLEYRVLQAVQTVDGPKTLVFVNLYTGRFHQIRVQFASRDLPICGDGKYGSHTNGTIALFSYKLMLENRVYTAMPESKVPWTLFQLPYEESKNETEIR